jgi:hypothetical protein
MEETAAFEVTPVQFAILNALIDIPGRRSGDAGGPGGF